MVDMRCCPLKSIFYVIAYLILIAIISSLESILYYKTNPNVWLYFLACSINIVFGFMMGIFVFRHEIFNYEQPIQSMYDNVEQ